jgi:hypothetical protein
MRKSLVALTLAALAGGAMPMLPTAALAADTPAAPAAHYSVATTKAGTLIDDPAAAAILKTLIPTVWGNEMFQSQGRDLTLKDIQQYEPVLTDEMLARIQAEFDKIPAKG